MTAQRDDDIKRLRRCLDEAVAREVEEPWFDAFDEMLTALKVGQWPELTPAQRRWVYGVHERLFDSPEYANDFSAGQVPLGSSLKTPTPEVLKRPLPMKPPGRR